MSDINVFASLRLSLPLYLFVQSLKKNMLFFRLHLWKFVFNCPGQLNLMVALSLSHSVAQSVSERRFDFSVFRAQQPGSSGIKNLQSRDFRDGILQNPGIPGFFGTGLA